MDISKNDRVYYLPQFNDIVIVSPDNAAKFESDCVRLAYKHLLEADPDLTVETIYLGEL